MAFDARNNNSWRSPSSTLTFLFFLIGVLAYDLLVLQGFTGSSALLTPWFYNNRLCYQRYIFTALILLTKRDLSHGSGDRGRPKARNSLCDGQLHSWEHSVQEKRNLREFWTWWHHMRCSQRQSYLLKGCWGLAEERGTHTACFLCLSTLWECLTELHLEQFSVVCCLNEPDSTSVSTFSLCQCCLQVNVFGKDFGSAWGVISGKKFGISDCQLFGERLFDQSLVCCNNRSLIMNL